MVGVLKIAALSAVLAAAVVTISEGRREAGPARFLAERYAAGTGPAATVEVERCNEGAWPYLEIRCEGSETRTIRRIELDRVETRVPNGSALVQAAASGRTLR